MRIPDVQQSNGYSVFQFSCALVADKDGFVNISSEIDLVQKEKKEKQASVSGLAGILLFLQFVRLRTSRLE
jgi:hypothetical protein